MVSKKQYPHQQGQSFHLFRRFLAASVPAAIAAIPVSSHAATSPPATTSAAPGHAVRHPVRGGQRSTARPEELHVTSTVRQRNFLQAMTVNTLSRDEIRNLNINSPKDIAAFVPGVASANATSGSTPTFSIRGIGLEDYSGANMSGTGIYFDGHLAPFPVFYSGQLLDLQEVNVEKGPQGFDYGRSTTGGAINMVSVQPSAKKEGYIDWGYSSYNTNTGKLAWNVPISSKVYNRVAFSYTKGDGWQHDVHTNQRYGAQDVLVLRNLTKILVSPDDTVTLNLHYTRDVGTPVSPQNTNADAMVWGSTPGTYGIAPNSPANAVNVGAFAPRRRENGGGVSVNYSHNFDNATFESVTSIDFMRRNINDNYDGEAKSVGDFVWDDTYISQSHDMRFSSSVGNLYRYTVGLYQSYDKISANYVNDEQDLFDSPLGTINSNFKQQNISAGIYVNNIINITKGLEFIASGRFSYDIRDFKGGTVDTGGFVTGKPGSYLSYLDESQVYHRFTGKVGLRYRITPNILVYGTISNGYKAGTYFSAPVTASQGLDYIRPESVLAYEVGAKAQLFHHRLELSGSLFDYEYRNRQTLVVANMPGNTISLTLASLPRARSRGGELQAVWHSPVPHLDLQAGFAYLDAQTLSSMSSLNGLSLLSPVSSHTQLPYAPRFSWDGVARYTIDVSPRYHVALQVSYTWKARFWSSLSDPNARLGQMSSLGARMTFAPRNDKWQASVYVENAADKHTDVMSFTTNDNSRVQYIQTPRWVGCDLRYNF